MNEFLQSRVDYLQRLPSIANGWIAGGGKVEGVAPSVEACALATQVLQDLSGRAALLPLLNANTLLLAPLVKGGVCIELNLKEIQASLAVDNEMHSEYHLFKDDFRAEAEGPARDAVKRFSFLLDHLGLVRT